MLALDMKLGISEVRGRRSQEAQSWVGQSVCPAQQRGNSVITGASRVEQCVGSDEDLLKVAERRRGRVKWSQQSETQLSSLCLLHKSSSHTGPQVISSCFQTESCFQKLEHKNKLSSSPTA